MSEAEPQSDPGIKSVKDYLIYGLSIPERTLRSAAAVVGGAINESAVLLAPQAFRDSKSYKTFVQQMLDLMTKDIGGVTQNQAVDSSTSSDPQQQAVQTQVENYVARKTVGGFIDLAGMATLHLSPIVLLAVVSDVAYGSKTYLHELAEQLKKEGVIAEDSSIDQASDLLEAIGEATSDSVTAFDTPPISIGGLQQTVQETTENLAKIDPTKLLPKSEIDRFWNDMQSIAAEQQVGLIQLSSAMTMYTLNRVETVSRGALTTIKVTGLLLDEHILGHYWQGLEQISKRGFYPVVAESSQPYIEAVWGNFCSNKETITGDIVSGKLFSRAWTATKQWLTAKNPPSEPSQCQADQNDRPKTN